MTNTIFFAFQNLNRFVFFLTGTLINKSQLITHTHKRLYSLEAYIKDNAIKVLGADFPSALKWETI